MSNIFIVIAGLIIGPFLMMRLPKLVFREKCAVSVSVIIPARNEAHNITELIDQLNVQTLLPYEIICVDDGSEDETAFLAKKAGARLIEAGTHPQGWIGKTWASQVGAQAASGELLLFLDADVRLQAHALEALAWMQKQYDGVVSVQPFHKVSHFYEHFSMYFNIISVAATGAGMPFLNKKTGMFGPVVILPRSLYLEKGGHSEVRSRVLEDLFLGKIYAKQGIPVTLAAGAESISYRMYPEGLRALWDGWTKNFFSGAVSVSVLLLILCIIWVSALTSVAIGLIRDLASPTQYLWSTLAIYGLCAAETAYLGRQTGNFRWPAYIFYPVFLAGFHIIFMASVIKHLVFRRVNWKGRTIRL